jgi:sigma-B regulation protein RsbU (phosphoserine phosphatase)
VRLEAGDFVFLFTDGVIDAVNTAGQYFGQEVLQRALSEHCRQGAAEMVADLDQALRDFTGATPPHDDITMVLLRRQ